MSQSYKVVFLSQGVHKIGDVSFTARTYNEARRKVTTIAREIGLPSTPWQLLQGGRCISSGVRAVTE